MKPISVLWATKIGDPDWKEQIITETFNDEYLERAKVWAVENGFDRLRVLDYRKGEVYNFLKTLNLGE